MFSILLIDTKHRRNEKERKGIKESLNDNRRTSKRHKQLIGNVSGRYTSYSRILIKLARLVQKLHFPFRPIFLLLHDSRFDHRLVWINEKLSWK